MIDVKTIESYDGGELLLSGNAITPAFGFINMPYLALFGGNVEANTPTERIASEQNFDFWGNSLMPNQPKIQYNSNTERTLNTVALNSSGRILIEQAVKRDLKFMEAFAKVNVSVAIIGVDRVRIAITLEEYANQQVKEFIFLWDGTLIDLTGDVGGSTAIPSPTIVQPFRYGNAESADPSQMLFGDSFPNLSYTGIAYDIDGTDMGLLTKFTNRMEASSGIFGGRIPWIAIYQIANANFRTAEVPLEAGVHNITFPTFGDLDFTILCYDASKSGADFSQVNATKTQNSFQVTMPMAGTVAYLLIKNDIYSDFRTGEDILPNGGGDIILDTPLDEEKEYIVLYMPLTDGYGNSPLVNVDFDRFQLAQGFPVPVNYLMIQK